MNVLYTTRLGGRNGLSEGTAAFGPCIAGLNGGVRLFETLDGERLGGGDGTGWDFLLVHQMLIMSLSDD